MDTRAMLGARISSLRDSLRHAEDALRAQLDALEALRSQAANPALRAAVVSNFSMAFERRRGKLDTLQRMIDSSQKLDGFWGSVQRQHEECRKLFEFCLSYIGGVVARNTPEGERFCGTADALLDEVMTEAPFKYPRCTILGDSSFYEGTTMVIRLSFPDYSVWSLPVAVHELGHYAMRRISDERDDFPFQEEFARIGGTEEEAARGRAFLHEYLADLFAVYTLGPSYACTCLFHIFSPRDTTAVEDGREHPSHRKRLHFIVQTLEEVNQQYQVGNGGFVEMFKKEWQQAWRAAGVEPQLDDNEAGKLELLRWRLYQKLDGYLSKARYGGWGRAQRLAADFMSRQSPTQLLGPNDKLADVLNAAWAWRLGPGSRTDAARVGTRAMSLCQQLMGRAGADV